MVVSESYKCVCFLLIFVFLCKVKVVLTVGYGQSAQSLSLQNSPIVIPAQFGLPYNDTVNSTRGVIYEFNYLEQKNRTTAVRISVDVVSDVDQNFPVLFVTKQQQGILSWQIPLYIEYAYPYNKVSRTLCPVDLEHRKKIEENQTIHVDVSTMQQKNMSFNIQATILNNFQINTAENTNVSVAPSEPQYFMYTFPSDVDSVVIEATSTDDYCMVLSVQDVRCPVMDLNRDVKFEGVYQTMSEKAAITIEKRNYDSGSVYIVMVLKSNDYNCKGIETIQPAGKERIKTVNLYVYGTISASKYWIGILGASGVFLGFYIIAFAIGICYHGCNKNRGIWTFTPHDEQYVAEEAMIRLQDIEVKEGQILYHAASTGQIYLQRPISEQDLSQIIRTVDSCSHIAVPEDTHSQASVNIQINPAYQINSADHTHSQITYPDLTVSQTSSAIQLGNANETSNNQQQLVVPKFTLTIDQSHDRKDQTHDREDQSHDLMDKANFSSDNTFRTKKSHREKLLLLREVKNHKKVTKAWLHDGNIIVKNDMGVLAEIDSMTDIDIVFATPPSTTPPPNAGHGEGDTDKEARASLNPGNRSSSYGAISADQGHDEIYKELGSVHDESPSHTATSDTISQDSLDSDDIDFLADADKEKDVFRTKTALYVCDLARKKMKRQDKNYKIYWRNLVAISIFYGLPVIQLVITYQNALHITGDQDICYYNFECSHPLGVLTSFNNVFSNIGYIMLGLLFLILVYRRSVIYRKVLQANPIIAKKYGIPQHSGLFYAMGLALCMEGIMSACYHVCPTYSNFQFDTSYMYIIACLCMLRIYQNRHPDISAKAHTSYLLMAVVIFIAVIGVVHGTSIFWILFACCDIILITVLSVHIYYMGRWKLDRGIFKRVLLMIRHEFLSCARPMYMDRFIMLLIVNILNWAFAIYGAVTEPGDFASFLLGIFIGNLLLYCTFYIIMKLRYREKIHPLAVICILAASIVWGFALYFFFFHLTSWQLTPSGSRAGNQKCIVLDFYDAHDVWHFLSATSMFFSFLILLTLDDDLFSKRRDHIPVF